MLENALQQHGLNSIAAPPHCGLQGCDVAGSTAQGAVCPADSVDATALVVMCVWGQGGGLNQSVTRDISGQFVPQRGLYCIITSFVCVITAQCHVCFWPGASAESVSDDSNCS